MVLAGEGLVGDEVRGKVDVAQPWRRIVWVRGGSGRPTWGSE